MKWNIQLGPRQAKPIQSILSAFTRESLTSIEVTGTHGKPETENRCAYQIMMGAGRADVAEAIEKLQEQFPVINVSNLSEFARTAVAILTELAKHRPEQDKRITLEEHEARLQRIADNQAKAEEHNARAAACWPILERLKPANAQALIVAEEHRDNSDIQSDYFNYTTARRVAIGWRTGSREDFRQLRQAAANFEFTAHLGPGCDRYTVKSIWTEDNAKGAEMGYFRRKGEYYVHGELHGKTYTTRAAAEEAIRQAQPLGTCDGVELAYTVEVESVEHRENWSMGAGNYLGVSKYSGWIVKSYELKYSGYRSDVVETEHLEALAAKPAARAGAAGWDKVEGGGSTVTVSENEEKDGLEIRFAEKPAAEVLTRLKSAGWRWSRFSSCWYAKRSDRARAFADALVGEQ